MAKLALNHLANFWNTVHYFVYQAINTLCLWSNRIDPILMFYKLPFARRHFERMGIDPATEVYRAFSRPDIGFSVIFAGALMFILIFSICYSLVLVYEGIFEISLRLSLYHFGVLGLVSYTLNHFLLFRHDKYLKYFEELEKMQGAKRKKWAWISFAVIFGILLFAVGSFVFMAYRT